MRILVCEDNPLTLRSIEYVLKNAGFDVVMAKDGDQGIRILNEEKVDLVITDINMPYTKGLELVRHVNTNLETKIPVIIVTGITLEETREHAIELGAKGFLTKPLDLDVLVKTVRSLSDKN
ncbi:MAG: response regulator [Bacteroidetes bacterium]|nr:response regulator [Bacteroidota bacterium]